MKRLLITILFFVSISAFSQKNKNYSSTSFVDTVHKTVTITFTENDLLNFQGLIYAGIESPSITNSPNVTTAQLTRARAYVDSVARSWAAIRKEWYPDPPPKQDSSGKK